MVKKFPDFFFYTCRVILRSEEYCSDEIPKFLTRKKCVLTWQPEHSCATIDLVDFNVFMFLSPKGSVFKGSTDKGSPYAIAL
jgi:hypothetical protein